MSDHLYEITSRSRDADGNYVSQYACKECDHGVIITSDVPSASQFTEPETEERPCVDIILRRSNAPDSEYVSSDELFKQVSDDEKRLQNHIHRMLEELKMQIIEPDALDIVTASLNRWLEAQPSPIVDYVIRCDASNNSRESIEAGILTVAIIPKQVATMITINTQRPEV